MKQAISLRNISKKYKLYKSSKERLLDVLLPLSYGKDFYAVKNVTFEANKGETIGFVGVNGSGKSTLINVMAGIIPETEGNVYVDGNITVLNTSSGLKETLTGRENIELKCLMMGFSKKEIKAMEQEIIDFSELGEFIDVQVSKYSSGMKARLGFAISTRTETDILVVDEALSVGDKTFVQKCLEKINEFKKEGKTILLVSHDHSQIKKFCDKVVWMEYGTLKDYGEVEEIMKKYEEFVLKFKKMSDIEKANYQKEVRNKK